MRYKRVYEILNEDKLLRKKLGPPDVVICRPDQTSESFPAEAVHVTEQIHNLGRDSYTLPKLDIIRLAYTILVKPKTESQTNQPSSMNTIIYNKPLIDELQERAKSLQDTVAVYKAQLDDCLIALKALKVKNALPKVEAPKTENQTTKIPTAEFENFVTELLKVGACKPADILNAYTEQFNGRYSPMTLKACSNRLSRMRKKLSS